VSEIGWVDPRIDRFGPTVELVGDFGTIVVLSCQIRGGFSEIPAFRHISQLVIAVRAYVAGQ